MRKTKAVWCDECKLKVFECEHLRNSNDASLEVPRDIPRDPGKRELVFLAINDLVPAQSVVHIGANPQISVKPRRLVVDPDISAFFRILDIKIGHYSQFAASAGRGVSASIFPPTPQKYQPVANLDGLPVIPLGKYLIFTVMNVSQSVSEFNALVWCDHAIEKTPFITSSSYDGLLP